MEGKELEYLKKALGNSEANFREGQLESIKALLENKRALVVQHTGWGKSIVYFLTTTILRENGAGPTLLISPLLSLMRNQIEAAKRMGLIAETINSSNKDNWDTIKEKLSKNEVDILLISPERLANDEFKNEILTSISNNIGLLVVDEAHCISDWGHDFRPDYRRILSIIKALPLNIPVLATTATANNRVVEDIKKQLGNNIDIIRGSLVRKSLKLQNINIPSQSYRLAWLAKNIPDLTGSGIVYTLTQRDAERVAEWLKSNSISAEAYHSGTSNSNEEDKSKKEELEQKLINNDIKVLVATVALGMGFDKPDLRFVIHFQRPSSVVHYYQQVGRAGRAVGEAYGILLCGEEDDNISDYFICSTFPPQKNISDILKVLNDSEDGLSLPEMEKSLNLRKSQIEKTLKFLTIESPSPITKNKSKWRPTPSASNYTIDQSHIVSILAIRKEEQKQMQDYMECSTCLMKFLQNALDDPSTENCGNCKNCNPPLLDESIDTNLETQAEIFLQKSYQVIKPRKKWPAKDILSNSGLKGSNITTEQQAKEGRALSLWLDSGWGKLVSDGKYESGIFDEKLVDACLEMISSWNPQPKPEWVTCIPSLSRPKLVSEFAEKLANKLNIPFIPCVEKIKENNPQKDMENSYNKVKNLDGVFNITNGWKNEPCLLVDDVIDSGCTFTIVAALLRKAGCSAVFPMALALNSPKVD